eukprot:4087553-Alexandrium_andersonii.AAC.1
MSEAPTGKTPKLGLLAAATVTLGGENTSATVARTSPGVATAAKSALARSIASSGGPPARKLGPHTPSWDRASMVSTRKNISAS